MIFIECKQGSPEWLQARAGVITASMFKTAISTLKDGRPTADSEKYAAAVAVERISGLPLDDGYNSWQMQRGHDLEPTARMAYEERTHNLASESGVVLTDDRMFGYSADGLVNEDGGIEIKCLVSPIELVRIWRDHDLSAYMHQMQGGLWITGRKWIDYVMYAPQLAKAGRELYYRRVERNDDFIDSMVEQLVAFSKRVAEYERILRGD